MSYKHVMSRATYDPFDIKEKPDASFADKFKETMEFMTLVRSGNQYNNEMFALTDLKPVAQKARIACCSCCSALM